MYFKPGASWLVQASLTTAKYLRDIFSINFLNSLCYSSHSLEAVSIFRIGRYKLVRINTPLQTESPLLPPRLVVPAMTKWRWAVALAAIQPDSPLGPTECLSGSPRVTTAAFYYSVKWAVKERYACSYLTMQNVSLLGREIRRQRGNQPLTYFFAEPQQQPKSIETTPCSCLHLWAKPFWLEICPEIC